MRRWRDLCHDLTVVCAAPDPAPVLTAFAQLPQIVAMLGAAERRAVGVTVEGVAVELLVAEPAALRHRAGPRHRLGRLRRRRSSRCPQAPDEDAVYAALGLPWCPPELRERPFAGEPPALVEPDADPR